MPSLAPPVAQRGRGAGCGFQQRDPLPGRGPQVQHVGHRIRVRVQPAERRGIRPVVRRLRQRDPRRGQVRPRPLVLPQPCDHPLPALPVQRLRRAPQPQVVPRVPQSRGVQIGGHGQRAFPQQVVQRVGVAAGVVVQQAHLHQRAQPLPRLRLPQRRRRGPGIHVAGRRVRQLTPDRGGRGAVEPRGEHGQLRPARGQPGVPLPQRVEAQPQHGLGRRFAGGGQVGQGRLRQRGQVVGQRPVAVRGQEAGGQPQRQRQPAAPLGQRGEAGRPSTALRSAQDAWRGRSARDGGRPSTALRSAQDAGRVGFAQEAGRVGRPSTALRSAQDAGRVGSAQDAG